MSDAIDRLVACLPALSKRSQRERGIGLPPPVPRPDFGATFTAIRDGRLVVSTGLKGTLGRGRRMVLDDADWRRVVMVLGALWEVRETHGRHYVVSPTSPKDRAPGAPPVKVLARYLAGAKVGELVSYRDGDPFNLTRRNLCVTGDRREFMRALRSAKAA